MTEFTGFLTLAAVMTAATVALVLYAVLRATPGTGADHGRVNAALHAAELGALEREHAAGALGAAEYALARDEILRRVIAEADTRAAAARAQRGRFPACVAALAVPLLAVAIYAAAGNPAALGRGAAATATLERHLRSAPHDGRAWIALAREHMTAHRYAEAAQAYERALDGAPALAGEAAVWCELADALGMAQGGTLAGRPRALVAKALALTPAHPCALEMAGSAAYEAGEYRDAVRHWTTLLAQLPPGTEAHRELESAVARAGRKRQDH